MSFSFLWHDYEASGVDVRHDRPVQFAAIRTDAALNPLGKPVVAYCQPAADLLYDPEAVLITGITPRIAQEKGVTEAAFAQVVHDALAQPGTCGVGYNTIRYDDELTRRLFWRTLHDPYAREWRNGGSRWDLLDCVRACYALRPEGIVWPPQEGDPDTLSATRPEAAEAAHAPEGASFRLEALAAANGLEHTRAHDALSDVEVTVALARLLRNTQPRLFDFCLQLRNKPTVLAQMFGPGVSPRDVLRTPLDGRPFLHVSGMYSAANGCLAHVATLGAHPMVSNQWAVWNLQHDPEELFALDVETIRLRLFTRTEALTAQGLTRLPIKMIHLNRSPVVIADLRTLSPARAEKLGIDPARAQRHAARLGVLLARHGAQWARTLAAVYQMPEEKTTADSSDALHVPRTPDPEDLYAGGFLGDGDRALLERLRALEPHKLAERLAHQAPDFVDPRLHTLLLRYRARSWPETLSTEERMDWQNYCQEKLQEGRHGGWTLAQQQAKIAILRAQHAGYPAQLALLDMLHCDMASRVLSRPACLYTDL